MTSARVKILIGMVAIILLGLTVFLIHVRIPEKKRALRIPFIIWHIVGTLSVLALFLVTCYMPDGLLEDIIIFISSLYIVEVLMHIPIIPIWELLVHFFRWIKKTNNCVYRFISNRGLFYGLCSIYIFVVFILGYINMEHLNVNKYEYSINKQANVSEVNIAVIADLHVGAGLFGEKMKSLVDTLNSQNPDMVVIVGDCFDETTSEADLKAFAECFKGINAPYGTYYAYGNHDYACSSRIENALNGANIRILSNSGVFINDLGIELIGRGDDNYELKDIDSIIADDKVNTQHPTIVLQHIPKDIASFENKGIDVVLCGHTHGEILPFVNVMRRLISPALKPIEKDKMFGDVYAITTSGVSNWGWHCKFPGQNEIVNLTLKFDVN